MARPKSLRKYQDPCDDLQAEPNHRRLGNFRTPGGRLRTAKSAQADFPTQDTRIVTAERDRLHRMLAADDRAAARVHPRPRGESRRRRAASPAPIPVRRFPDARGSSQSLESANGGAFGNWKPTSYARRIALDAVS